MSQVIRVDLWHDSVMRKIMTVQLSEAAADALDGIHRSSRLNKKTVVESALVWLASQTPGVQGAVLGTIPADLAPDVARLLLERMAKLSPAASDKNPVKRAV